MFSPNDDGIGDHWELKGIENHQDYEVLIFDRYGTRVFNAQPYSVPWDGTFKGKRLIEGAYYFVIRHNKRKNVLAGSVTLLR